MVSRSDTLAKPAPPTPLKRYFDQAVIPATIDIAGGLEVQARRLATQAQRAPLVSLGVALALGWTIRVLLRAARTD